MGSLTFSFLSDLTESLELLLTRWELKNGLLGFQQEVPVHPEGYHRLGSVLRLDLQGLLELFLGAKCRLWIKKGDPSG